MGKSRRSRTGAARKAAEPFGGQPRPVKEPSDPKLAALRSDKILPVVKDLKSADPKARTSAAGAIANIVEDARCRKLLLREQVVHIVLSETLSDSSIESRAAGWEILNVLAQHEESDFCVHLFRCDVLTPAAHALNQILETLQSAETPFSKLTKAQQEFVWRITLSIVELLGQLAEARPEILDAVSGNATIARAFFALTASSVAPFEIHWNAVTGLARLCEDQRTLSQAIVDDPESGCYAALLKLREAGGPMAVAACSALHAVFAALEWFDHSPGRNGATDAVLVPTLTQILEQQLKADSPSEVLSLALQTLAMIGTTLETSLEKGNRDEAALRGAKSSGQPNGGDRSDEGEEVDDDSDDEMADDGEDASPRKAKDSGAQSDDDDDDEVDEDMDMDMENVTGAGDKDGPEEVLNDLPTLRALVATAVPQIVQAARAPADADADEAAVAIRLDALSALSNIAWTVSCLDLQDAGNAGILQSWAPVARRVWLEVVRPVVQQSKSAADLPVAAKATSLAWALARALAGETPVDAGELDRFMALRDSCSGQPAAPGDDSDPFQSPAVLCIGVLGQMARDPAPVSVNRQVGAYFFRLVDALPATPPAEAVEAINQLLDLYADEAAACDAAVFWPGHFLNKAEAAMPKVKAMAKAIDKRTMAELRTRADEVVLNLGRFVQYKKKHAPKSG